MIRNNCYRFSEGLSKESSSNLSQALFTKFSAQGLEYNADLRRLPCTCAENFAVKSLWEGVWGDTFLRKGPPRRSDAHIAPPISLPHTIFKRPGRRGRRPLRSVPADVVGSVGRPRAASPTICSQRTIKIRPPNDGHRNFELLIKRLWLHFF